PCPVGLQDPEVQKHATQILRKMLQQEEAELQRCQELYNRSPGAAVEEQLEGARRRVCQLQLKIRQETGNSLVGALRGQPLSSWCLGTATQGVRSPSQGVGSTCQRVGDRPGRPLIIGPEEDCDPGYFNNECDSLFQDLGRLKARPAHLGVFLRYIFSQADPSPLLFYLCSEVFQQIPAKDSRALGKDIWNIFLDRSA
ncbi:ARHGB factor, partial [Sakesphorus luctuosus]|nr:ARHGB factor [Sakesphorus luctuosus]